MVSDLINYPNLKKKSNNRKEISYANRGMSLEKDLDLTNEFYRNNGKAVIYKKPIPLQIVSVDYQRRSAAKITEAYFKTPSTTDYNGVYRGYYLDFDAKETTSLSSFPFSSLHKHQLEHLKAVKEHRGIAFLIVRFVKRQEDYLILAKDLLEFRQANIRKSLPYLWIKENSYKIRNSLNPRICYLEVIDAVIKEENYA